MRLHQINQLTYPEPLESTWQNSLQTGDQILLIESGILRATQQTELMQTLMESKKTQLFYLKSDACAYGISPTLGTGLTDEDWVTLTFSANTHISW